MIFPGSLDQVWRAQEVSIITSDRLVITLAAFGIVMAGALSNGSMAQGNFNRNSAEHGDSCTHARKGANQNQ